MWKTSIAIFITLITTMGALLFWQWDAYSNQNKALDKESLEKAKQDITVESKKNGLQITQTISGLTSGNGYLISIPDSIEKWKCMKPNDKKCDTKDSNPKTLISEKGKIQIQIDIPLGNNIDSFLLNDWKAAFPGLSIVQTTVEIVDGTRREGSWVSGLPLLGKKTLDYIDFYLYEGSNDDFSLYWQKSPLYMEKGQKGIDYYSEQQRKQAPSFQSIKKLNNFPSLSIVFTDKHVEMTGKGILIVNKRVGKKNLERKIATAYVRNKFEQLPLREAWLPEAFASLIISQDSKSPKGKSLIEDLKEQLSEKQLDQLMTLVINEKEPISTEKLDEFLQRIKGKSTSYFTINKNEQTELIPLFFYEDKQIIVNHHKQKDIKVINTAGKQLFPFVKTLTALGFEVKELPDQETLLLNKGSNSYRFFLNQNLFIYNEEDYGLLETPLATINGQIYIEHHWLQSLFNVSFEEKGQEVILSIPF